MKAKKDCLRRALYIFIIGMAIGLCNSAPTHAQSIIPQPQSMKITEGQFVVNNESTKFYTNLKGKDKRMMRKYIGTLPYKFLSGKEKNQDNIVKLLLIPEKRVSKSKDKTDCETCKQKYTLSITPQQIVISATNAAGLFYGIQSMLQLTKRTSATTHQVACAEITDVPRFEYRGLMLDVSRHFFPKEFIYKQIDALSYFKINYLHLHLTDAAGWRIQIKKYPKLIKETAYRTESNWTKWWSKGSKQYCAKDAQGAYGGYYTQRDIKNIVKYAAIHHITIIPEIEMPGHSEEVLAAYPELSCSGKPYQNGEFCIGKEITYRFLENVLKEVIKLFPSQYIHIGGDEAGKSAWKACPLCQKRMKDEHLKNEGELQAYLIARIERYLNSHGKKLIGWDEILEGKLPPRATVMSWRGEQGGIDAATSGHNAIMTPGKYCYFDNIQDAPDKQPISIGGYLPLDRVYSYNPVPDSLSNTLAASFIKGVQANLWTEHVETPEYAEHMIYPRILAIAEVGWTNLGVEERNFDNFRTRALQANKQLMMKGYNAFDLDTEEGHRIETKTMVKHEALGKKVIYNAPFSPSYRAQNELTLTDGKLGDWNYNDGAWQGFIAHGRLDVTIDMEKVTDICDVSAEFMQSSRPGVFAPASVTVSVSDDGVNFTEIDKQVYEVSETPNYFIKKYTWNGNATGRYVRFQANSGNKHAGWVFTDEIVVNKSNN